MSCGGGGCGSCGTEDGAQDTTDNTLLPAPTGQSLKHGVDTRSLVSRIQHVAGRLRVQLEVEQQPDDADELVDEAQAAEFSLLFNDIAVTMARGNAQSVKVGAAAALHCNHATADNDSAATHQSPDMDLSVCVSSASAGAVR